MKWRIWNELYREKALPLKILLWKDKTLFFVQKPLLSPITSTKMLASAKFKKNKKDVPVNAASEAVIDPTKDVPATAPTEEKKGPWSYQNIKRFLIASFTEQFSCPLSTQQLNAEEELYVFEPSKLKRDPFHPTKDVIQNKNSLLAYDITRFQLVAILTGMGSPKAMLLLPNRQTEIITKSAIK